MRISAHGITVELPAGWEGRIYRRPEGDPTLHAANFPLPAQDADFGSVATARMPRGGSFLCLTEYRPGNGLTPGEGLYRARSLPLPLPASAFRDNALLVARPGQAGLQHFFTAGGRPFCLYAVIAHHRAGRHAQVADAQARLHEVNRVLSTVAIDPVASTGPSAVPPPSPPPARRADGGARP
jgi:hypothetical protein